MFFVLSKVVGFFLIPSNLIILIGLAGISLLPTRFLRTGRRLLVASTILIAGIGVLPIGNALMLPLEERFPQWEPAQGEPSGIIVLGGAINAQRSVARNQVSLGEAAERITAAVELTHKYPTARIVFSGGSGELTSRLPESDVAVRLFESLGVPRHRIALETRSRNTAENAAFTRQLVAPKPGDRWLLITSAMHMPRAVGSFRQAGFSVEAYPVDYQTAGWEDFWTLPGSLMDGINRTDTAVREWLGLFVYWITGRISAPFPKPISPEANSKYLQDVAASHQDVRSSCPLMTQSGARAISSSGIMPETISLV
jgi:uncharacterized SAM-binding protein YcdF (DUF218 family)